MGEEEGSMQMTSWRQHIRHTYRAATIGRTASRLNVVAFLMSLKEEDKLEGEQKDEAMEAMSYIGLFHDATKMIAVAPLPITHHLLPPPLLSTSLRPPSS